MKIRYKTCDGESIVTEKITKAEFFQLSPFRNDKTVYLHCTRVNDGSKWGDGSVFEVCSEEVEFISEEE